MSDTFLCPPGRTSALAFPTVPLLACPFCGRPARWYRTGSDVGVECGDESNCPGRAQTDVYEQEHAECAAHVWNQRVPDFAAELLAACRSAIVALKGREHDGFLRDAIELATGRRP